jgi:hypothetical protein
MTAVSEATIPFSAKLSQERDGTNGIGIDDAVSELIDNSFDANARKFSLAMIPAIPTVPMNYIIALDTDGDGLSDPRILYGISRVVPKKPSGKRGLKNNGFPSAMGRLAPFSVTSFGRTGGARCSTLQFDLGNLYAEIDRRIAAGMCEYREIDATILPGVLRCSPIGSGFTEETSELLDNVLACMRASGRNYGSLTDTLQQIRNNSVRSYCLHVLQYTTFPADLEAQIVDAFKSYRFTYHKDLRSGLEMEFIGPTLPPVHNTATHACPPVDPTTAQTLIGHYEVRVPEEETDLKTATTFLALTLTTGTLPPRTCYMTWTPSTTFSFQRKTSPLSITKPSGWDTAITVGGVQRIELNVPRSEVVEDQIRRIGSSRFKSVENLQGLCLNYSGRILGPPLWNWGAKRNAGAIRIEISTTDQMAAEKYWAVQTRKHVAKYENLHPALQLMLNWLVKTIINKRITVRTAGVADWRFADFWEQLINPGHKVSTLPDPYPATTDESDAESEASASSGSSAAAALAEEVPTIVHKGPPASVPVVTHARAPPVRYSEKEVLTAFNDLKVVLNAKDLPSMIATATTNKGSYAHIMKAISTTRDWATAFVV